MRWKYVFGYSSIHLLSGRRGCQRTSSGTPGKETTYSRALALYLSREVPYRLKMGFAVPLSAWFRGPLCQRVRDALLGDTLLASGLFDMRRIEPLVTRHKSGRWDHSTALWTLLMFEAFVRRVLGRERAAA